MRVLRGQFAQNPNIVGNYLYLNHSYIEYVYIWLLEPIPTLRIKIYEFNFHA